MANEIVLREIMRQVECWPLYALAPVKATRENKRFFRFFILSIFYIYIPAEEVMTLYQSVIFNRYPLSFNQ